jgi:hypothetical protein
MGPMAEAAWTLPSVFTRIARRCRAVSKGFEGVFLACTRPGPWFLMAKG